ncbi:uncharacterized protein METZ01_LOCUS193106 [marine metagenome]|uniref:Uncharacterized protein n=1 Tax=marine metagenome TaxID=408172 RepID=A0A382DQA2_9ZZZZ
MRYLNKYEETRAQQRNNMALHL